MHLRKEFGDKYFVALAGVYRMKNVEWEHHYCNTNSDHEFHSEKNVCSMYMPTRIGIFTYISLTTETTPNLLGFLTKLSICQFTHCLCLYHHSAAEYLTSLYRSRNTEYLGYFSPVENLYRAEN